MMEKNDKKIQGQSVIIQKMRTLIELQKFKIKTEDFSSLLSEEISNTSQNNFYPIPLIVIEDTNLLSTGHDNIAKQTDTNINMEKTHPVNLKRQTALIKKGSERPKITVAPNFQLNNPMKGSISCHNLFFSQTKPQVPSRANVNAKLYGLTNHNTESQATNHSDDDSGHWSLPANDKKPHNIIRTNSYEKALGLDDQRVFKAGKTNLANNYSLSKYASQPHLYF